MMLGRVFVNVRKDVIGRNRKVPKEERGHPIRYSKGKSGKPQYSSRLAILDKDGNEVAEFLYDADAPILKCGARVVLVAHHGVKAKDRDGCTVDFIDARKALHG